MNNFNNPIEFMEKFSQFVQDYNKNYGQDPKEKVQQLLDSGQMSQEQYDKLRNIANQMLGTQY